MNPFFLLLGFGVLMLIAGASQEEELTPELQAARDTAIASHNPTLLRATAAALRASGAPRAARELENLAKGLKS